MLSGTPIWAPKHPPKLSWQNLSHLNRQPQPPSVHPFHLSLFHLVSLLVANFVDFVVSFPAGLAAEVLCLTQGPMHLADGSREEAEVASGVKQLRNSRYQDCGLHTQEKPVNVSFLAFSTSTGEGD